jgi:16S rRNA (guanine527-N7)-methyltransferase
LQPEPPEPAAIAAGAAALGLGLTNAQVAKLAGYARLLMRWNAVHNLTAARSAEELLTHHLLDSLAVVPQLARVAPQSSERVLDVGSGGGLPGIVLAIAMPSLRLSLAEAAQKKCAFLIQARVELALDNVEVVHGRAEALSLPPFDVIVARALATLARLVAWTGHLLKPEGCWLAMKGKAPSDELAALPPGLIATVEPLQVPGLDEERHLVVIRSARGASMPPSGSTPASG